eukprot:CAMPEP_0202891328 /NCGR_PEP_ID=MMETSP1392-20130828/1414_1 /ASSEMBLY_ACC=CAM_ASM_000868 /TAXON_ID=225041 /ORGANISM="Chlamydomonas chlamydogama, Strain SAG 11-48b" /LENGTH=140 /DNA_ID=CAMNT_0049575041 /DNA_START=490 /DNA_END=913 /DNA_ORIENTATION=+
MSLVTSTPAVVPLGPTTPDPQLHLAPTTFRPTAAPGPAWIAYPLGLPAFAPMLGPAYVCVACLLRDPCGLIALARHQVQHVEHRGDAAGAQFASIRVGQQEPEHTAVPLEVVTRGAHKGGELGVTLYDSLHHCGADCAHH